MSELNKKEEQFKDILGGLEIDINTNDLWANIESELPQPKKKRRFGIFFLLGLMSLTLVAVAWSFSNATLDDLDTPSTEISTEFSSSTIMATAEGNSLNSETQADSQEGVNHPINNRETVSNSKRVSNTNTVINKNSNQINTASHTTNNTKDNITSTPNTFNIDNSPAIVLNINDSEITNTERFQSLNINSNNNKIELQEERIDLLTIHFTPTLSSQLLETANRQRIESSQSIITPLKQMDRQFIIQLKLGANQNITSIGDINSTGEFDASEFDFEKDRLGLSGTLALGLERNGWRFLAGISYHQQVSSYERNDVLIVKDPSTGIESYKILSDGTVTSQNGTITVTSARDNEISYHRQHKAIDLHATIGKRLWSYKGFVLIADLGLGINAFTNSNGYYLTDKAFGFTKISENDNHPYKNSTSWNAIASMELGYDFGNTRIGLSPFIRYNPNSITAQSHIYSMKNSQVGIQLSLTHTPTRE